jgi:FkbM family methyltransferase
MKKVLKKIYHWLPFKKQVFQLTRFFWIPPYNVYKHLYFEDVFKVKVDNGKSFRIMHYGMEIENDIFWKGLTGGWEKLSMQLWIKLCKNAKTILDVGANTGIYALAAKATNPQAKVIAFEPLKRVCSRLKRNAGLNNFNIDCIEKALSNKTGKTIIYENDADFIAAASLNADAKAYGPLNTATEIEAITLDDFISENNLSGIDLIKIDVETFEPQVLEGFKKHLSQFKPTFIIEILMDEVGEKIQRMLDGLGYFYFNIDDKQEKIHRVDQIVKSDYFNYLVCSKETAKTLNLI